MRPGHAASARAGRDGDGHPRRHGPRGVPCGVLGRVHAVWCGGVDAGPHRLLPRTHSIVGSGPHACRGHPGGAGPAAGTAGEAANEPTRLRIDAIEVDMPVTGVGVEASGQMQLPTDPAVAGWYRYGPDAASHSRNVVLAAHVDAPDYPIGPLARLRELASRSVGHGRRRRRERPAPTSSSRSTYYEKTALPTADLFARDGAPALVIITCGGPFDSGTGHYRDNVVAIARPQ